MPILSSICVHCALCIDNNILQLSFSSYLEFSCIHVPMSCAAGALSIIYEKPAPANTSPLFACVNNTSGHVKAKLGGVFWGAMKSLVCDVTTDGGNWIVIQVILETCNS